MLPFSSTHRGWAISKASSVDILLKDITKGDACSSGKVVFHPEQDDSQRPKEKVVLLARSESKLKGLTLRESYSKLDIHLIYPLSFLHGYTKCANSLQFKEIA